MKSYNSIEFIKANIWRSEDNTTAHLHSDSVVGHLKEPVSRDEAWMEALEIANSILSKEGYSTAITEDNGNSETAYWKK